MSFNLENFVTELRLDEFNGLKKAALFRLGSFINKLNSSMGKGDIKKLVLNYLVEEERKAWSTLLCPVTEFRA